MRSNEIRKKFLDFFEKRNHKIVPSSSLIPDDPSVLFTTAGMQQFKKYYIGELDAQKDFRLPNGSSAIGTTTVQKCIRTSDIDEVGDESHLSFFEMLGNFSFGGYFKKEAIKYAHEFITAEMGLKIDYVSVFKGNSEVPVDEESIEIWRSIDPTIQIIKEGIGEVFWGPTGSEGPCGPTTEIYVNGLEVWNIVFNQYYFSGSREELLSGKTDKKLKPVEKPGVDTGMGLERLAMIMQEKNTIYETDLFDGAQKTHFSYRSSNRHSDRIVMDHLRAAVFLIGDGLEVSNKDQGYVLRRLIRRAVTNLFLQKYSDGARVLQEMVEDIIDLYSQIGEYKYLIFKKNDIANHILAEQKTFLKVLPKAIRELEKKYPQLKAHRYEPGKNMVVHEPQSFKIEDAFYFRQTFGLPLDIMKDLVARGFHRITIDEQSFESEFKRHQEISKQGAEKKFGGHGLILDTGELKAANEEELKKVTRLHTATHLLQAALRKVIGNDVKQAGSDINADRLRFDFSFPRKVTEEEINKIESMINKVIKDDLPVTYIELPLDEAKRTGAIYLLKEKYPDKVKVYSVGPSSSSGSIYPFSREFCGGPHVTHTGDIGGIRIIKEESVSTGTRRIRAVLE